MKSNKSKKFVNPCVIPGSKIVKMPKKILEKESVQEAIERESFEENSVSKD